MSDGDVSCTTLATRHASCTSSSDHACQRFWNCYKTFTFCSLLPGAQSLAPATRNDIWSEHVGNVLRATAVCTFSTSQLPKVHRRWCGLCVFTAKCALRHNGLHFFHLNFQTCSVFLASSLQNLLRATTACNFSSPISPDGSAPGTLESLLFDPKKITTPSFSTFLCGTPASTFFWLFLSSHLLSSSFLFSDSSHICFPICP